MLLNHFKNIHREINFQVPSVFFFYSFTFVNFKAVLKILKNSETMMGQIYNWH